MRRAARTARATAVILAAFAVLATAAEAHHATAITADCSAVTLTYNSTEGTRFTGTILTNDTPNTAWDITVHGGGGAVITQQLVVPYQAPAGTFTLVARWAFSTGESGDLAGPTLTCSAPAPPPAVATPAPIPPVVVAPPVTPTQPQIRPPAKPRPKHRCTHGRRHLVYKHGPNKGKHFTLCVRPKPTQPQVRPPQFTG